MMFLGLVAGLLLSQAPAPAVDTALVEAAKLGHLERPRELLPAVRT